MSRPIKFRAWDKGEKCYWYDAQATYDDRCGNCGCFETDFQSVLDSNNYVVEQYTGLKDKNDKEIYEGDIVNLEYYEKPFGRKRWNRTYPRKGKKDINVVSFEEGFFKFYEEDKDGYGSELPFSDYGEWEGKDGEYKYVAEVIGNIHENPELLEREG